MPSGLEVNGVDLDTFFAPYTSGPKANSTGFQINGSDINNRFAPFTGGVKANSTGFQTSGVDLADIFAKFYEVNLIGGTAAAFKFTGTAYAGWNFKPTGEVTRVGNQSATHENWLLSGNVGDFEIRVTKTSGTRPSGILDSWLNLSTFRYFQLSTSGRLKRCSLLVEIRKEGTTEILASANYTIRVEVSNF